MVYVYEHVETINKYLTKKLTTQEIIDALLDLGCDVKGEREGVNPELKIELTAEKIDMISAVGIARAIAFYKGQKTKLTKYEVLKAKNKVIVDKSVEDTRPKTVAAILRNVPMTQEFLDTIIDLQERIHISFGRNRKKVAIGIYPLSAITFPVTYQALEPSKIKFQPLGFDKIVNATEILEYHETGKKYGHLLSGFSKYPIFIDSKKNILSMPPIINSYQTGRVEPHHTELFIECSGLNLKYLDDVLKVIVTTFVEMGSQVEAVEVDYGTEKYVLDLSAYDDKINVPYVNSLIGINVTAKEMKVLLEKMMYEVSKIDGENISVKIPCFRSDVWHDVDIADDIARAYGYNNIVPKSPAISSVGQQLSKTRFYDDIAKMFTQMGFLELYSYMLTSTEFQFKAMNRESEEYVALIDSADQGTNMIRTRILPEVLRSLHINRQHKYPQKVFELGFIVQPDAKAETKAKNIAHVCVAIADPKANYTSIKGVFDETLKLLGVSCELKEDCDGEHLIEGRSAKIVFNGQVIGCIGELHPSVLTNFGLLVPVVVFELNIDALFQN